MAARQLGSVELPVTATGDGADGLVQSWATRRDDGTLAVLVWDHTLDQTKRDGVPELARTVWVQLTGVAAETATVTRLDREHGDITTLAHQLGVGDWPTDGKWDTLRAVDRWRPERVDARLDGDATVLEIDLPQPEPC
ncbi:MAG: hypothetical protein ACXV2J_05230 [Actinomycetes bacterium]